MAIHRGKRIPARTKTLLLLAAASCVPVTGAQPVMKWWYREPAARYWEGLPLSNGRLAAMGYGRVRDELVPLNDESLWSGAPYDMQGRWQARWTWNINLQECYWPAENANMAQSNEALLEFVENLSQAGARSAWELYGCRGWVAHHGTDVWLNTAPTDFTGPGIWPTGGGTPAGPNAVKAPDFLLPHGNGPDDPFRFGDADNHMLAALGEYVSWGYFDPGKSDYAEGHQCPPVNWGVGTERTRQCFAAVKAVTGA